MMNRNILNPMMWTTGSGPTPTDYGIFWNTSSGLISLSSDGENWITISDKNLGASQVYNDGDTLSEENCGKYFQRGNNYGFPWTGNVTTSSTLVNTEGFGPYYTDSTFRTGGPNGDWTGLCNENLWGQTMPDNTDEGRRSRSGPFYNPHYNPGDYNDRRIMATGAYIPSKKDWQLVDSLLSSLGLSGDYSKLFIPKAGYRNGETGELQGVGTSTNIWTSTTEHGYGVVAGGGRAAYYHGYSIRGAHLQFVSYSSDQVTLFENETGYIRWHPRGGPVIDGVRYGVISITAGNQGISILDRNLGATQIYQEGAELSEANCGKYYQRGNCYGFPGIGSTEQITTSDRTVDTRHYGPYYYRDVFVTSSGNWSTAGTSGINNNLWGDETNTLKARQGICKDGQHIPTREEYVALIDTMTALGIDTGNGNCMKTYLKMPFAGNRSYSSAGANYQGTSAQYWSSTVRSTDAAYMLFFDSSGLSHQNANYRSFGFSVRPFKNEPVEPDSTWTKLY